MKLELKGDVCLMLEIYCVAPADGAWEYSSATVSLSGSKSKLGIYDNYVQ